VPSLNIKFPDGTIREYQPGTKIIELLTGIKSDKLVVAARLNGQLVDLETPLRENGELQWITIDSPEGKEIYWHSTSHVMAQAAKELFPEVKLAIGPPVEDGFYYDFQKESPFTLQDLEKIENKMREIIAADLPFIRKVVTREEAYQTFREREEPFKLELLDEISEETVSLYQLGNFIDLCRGPHLPRSGYIKAFKLLSVAGAYWRGDENQPMLQRIYGTSFPTEEELQQYLHRLEEAKRRDHRRLGRELDLFSIHEEAGAGLVYWHPKGFLVRKVIQDFWTEEHYRRGYQLVFTPHIAQINLWQISGHWEYYRENMYSPIDIEGRQFILKPMNCPGHILIYKSQTRSYRDLPLRWAELGTIYRYERSGVLHGLLRVRGCTQDDAHIFCRPDQLEEELVGVLDLTRFMLKTFGIESYKVLLSTRPEKYAGTLEIWEKGTDALRRALERQEMDYQINPGEGVFYGPKIDIGIRDALDRIWQGPTIQVDFNLPERFDANYIGEDGLPYRVAMIHRTVLGSMERFFGCLLEHYAGALPLWLSPVQIKILPITHRHQEYARKVSETLSQAGLRVEIDDRNEKTSYKIREAEIQKIPYMLIVGDREVKENTLAVRRRGGKDQGQMYLMEFCQLVSEELHSRKTVSNISLSAMGPTKENSQGE